MKPLHEQIIAARKISGFTQEELADKIAVTRQAVSSWERNKSQPDIDSIVCLASALNYQFIINDETVIGPIQKEETLDSGIEQPLIAENQSESKPKGSQRLVQLAISFIAGVLATLLIVLCIIPALTPSPQPGYSIAQNEGGKTGPETVHWFKEAETPHAGKPYVVISFSENPAYARRNSDFVDGVGWKYTVYLTEYNGFDFYPETYTMYYFRDEDTSITDTYTAQDLEAWWGESVIPARRQQCVSSGDPVQNIIGIGIKVSGKDANGETMEFYGYMECSQEIKE